MSDEVDRATEAQEMIMNAAIRKREVVLTVSHDGECHYCGEIVQHPKLFCNGECATQHDKLQNRR